MFEVIQWIWGVLPSQPVPDIFVGVGEVAGQVVHVAVE